MNQSLRLSGNDIFGARAKASWRVQRNASSRPTMSAIIMQLTPSSFLEMKCHCYFRVSVSVKKRFLGIRDSQPRDRQ